jgi:integrase
MKLTVKKIERLLSAGVKKRHTDDDVRGLVLDIQSTTSAAWSLRWQRDHKSHQMGLGSARPGSSSYLSLAAAREKAKEHYSRLARGIDPLHLRHAERAARIAAEAKQVSFKTAAERYHEAHEKGWTRHYANEFLSSLERWAYQRIGSLDVAAITRDHVLHVLEQQTRKGGTFWHTHVVTADRVRNRIERTLDFASVRGWRCTDNCARWKNYLENVLPAPRKVASVKHLDAVPYDELPQLMAKLAADDGVTSKALRFTILTAVRINEALGARWDEIDLGNATWTVPAARMKARKPHVVPLSPQVVGLLRSLYTEPNNPHVFVGTRPGTATAANTVMLALRRAGRPETIHGFRSSFRDWVEERTSFPSIVAEMALAHSPGNAVVKAYRRTDLVLRRRRLMESWGAFCTTPTVATKVIPLPHKEASA